MKLKQTKEEALLWKEFRHLLLEVEEIGGKSAVKDVFAKLATHSKDKKLDAEFVEAEHFRFHNMKYFIGLLKDFEMYFLHNTLLPEELEILQSRTFKNDNIYKVLFVIKASPAAYASSEYGKGVAINQIALARAMGISQPAVSKILKKLVEMELIQVVDDYYVKHKNTQRYLSSYPPAEILREVILERYEANAKKHVAGGHKSTKKLEASLVALAPLLFQLDLNLTEIRTWLANLCRGRFYFAIPHLQTLRKRYFTWLADRNKHYIPKGMLPGLIEQGILDA